MAEPPFPQPGADLDYANPACPMTASEVLVITAFESIVIAAYIKQIVEEDW